MYKELSNLTATELLLLGLLSCKLVYKENTAKKAGACCRLLRNSRWHWPLHYIFPNTGNDSMHTEIHSAKSHLTTTSRPQRWQSLPQSVLEDNLYSSTHLTNTPQKMGHCLDYKAQLSQRLMNLRYAHTSFHGSCCQCLRYVVEKVTTSTNRPGQEYIATSNPLWNGPLLASVIIYKLVLVHMSTLYMHFTSCIVSRCLLASTTTIQLTS